MSVPALPAATVIVLRDAEPDGVDTYMVKRPARTRFLPNAHVFPGGRVEAQDEDPAWLPFCGVRHRAVAPPVATLAHGIAAIRELFEEAGLLLVRSRDGRLPGADTWWPASDLHDIREALIAGTTTFLPVCQREGWQPALDLLTPLSRWITPEIEPRRFDTVFYVAAAPPGQDAQVDGREAVSGAWFRPADGVAKYLAGEISLVPPTLRTLEDLSDLSSCRAAIDRAVASRVCTILPRLLVERGTQWLLLPGDPLFPAAPDSTMPPPTRFVLEAGRWRSAPAPE